MSSHCNRASGCSDLRHREYLHAPVTRDPGVLWAHNRVKDLGATQSCTDTVPSRHGPLVSGHFSSGNLTRTCNIASHMQACTPPSRWLTRSKQVGIDLGRCFVQLLGSRGDLCHPKFIPTWKERELMLLEYFQRMILQGLHDLPQRNPTYNMQVRRIHCHTYYGPQCCPGAQVWTGQQPTASARNPESQ